MTTKHPLRLAIDIGGTFTDAVLMDAAATVIATAKTATTPTDPSEGARWRVHASCLRRPVPTGPISRASSMARRWPPTR
jgi:predicted NBD/HSP70 family sugar kinase